MGADAMEGDGHRIRRKGLIFEAAAFAAVKGVTEIGSKPAKVYLIHSPADLLVGSEEDADLSAFNTGVLNEKVNHIHDDRDAGLVVGAKKGCSGSGYDIIPFPTD